MPVDFPKHLHRQIVFLSHSCASYDAGHSDEAIRIATVLRILVHNTQNSTSLLKHLGATTINLLSTTYEASPQSVSMVGLGMMQIGGNQSSYYPHLGQGPINDMIPVSKWWSQIVMVIEGHRISRRQIVLGAANKDGGAHIDAALGAEYEALAADGAAGSFVYPAINGQEVEEPIQNAHLVSLRQLGYEVLNSPELLALQH